ncbi:MAG TPA: MBL fold metallo-hydrolase [Ignavibacteriaceae bacterium]|nr:MBL fold metallo-hydrolase [Ignavibacteriaceae bacterium]
MKINFIGTGSGKTSLKRHHSSFLISSDNHDLLVDCGDGVSAALLKQNISYLNIDSILISHLHADHYSGLASLITQMKLLNRTEPLSIYIHKSLTDFIKDYLFNSYLFFERMDFELKIIPIETEMEIRLSESFYFSAKINSHLEKYSINDFTGKLSFVSLSFLFKEKTRSVIYTGDIGSAKDLYLFKDKVNWFITEVSHIDLNELLILQKENNAEKILLTHIDDESEEAIQKFINSLSDDKKSSFITTQDGFIIQHNS